MGVLRDLWRLMRVGAQQSAHTDFAANLKASADLAEQYAGFDPGQAGTHGAAGANPFENMSAYASMQAASGTVLSLEPAGGEVAGSPIYRVRLTIRLDGQEAYETTYQTVIAAGALPNWQPGKVLPFRVSRADPHSLMLG